MTWEEVFRITVTQSRSSLFKKKMIFETYGEKRLYGKLERSKVICEKQ